MSAVAVLLEEPSLYGKAVPGISRMGFSITSGLEMASYGATESLQKMARVHSEECVVGVEGGPPLHHSTTFTTMNGGIFVPINLARHCFHAGCTFVSVALWTERIVSFFLRSRLLDRHLCAASFHGLRVSFSLVSRRDLHLLKQMSAIYAPACYDSY